jgi:hypothetical protein
MPQTTLISNYESIRQNLNLNNLQLKSYHKIKPNHHQYYTSMYTNEIFNILPELHRYQHITNLNIHILTLKQLENMEILLRQQIHPCPNITDIELTVKIKIPAEICHRLFNIFPNITRLGLRCPKGDCIDISTVTPNLKQLRLCALKIPESCVDYICAMPGLESICFDYEDFKPMPKSVKDKLFNAFGEKIKEHPDWLQWEAHSFWFNY